MLTMEPMSRHREEAVELLGLGAWIKEDPKRIDWVRSGACRKDGVSEKSPLVKVAQALADRDFLTQRTRDHLCTLLGRAEHGGIGQEDIERADRFLKLTQ